jgi:hypothetical protein
MVRQIFSNNRLGTVEVPCKYSLLGTTNEGSGVEAECGWGNVWVWFNYTLQKVRGEKYFWQL